MRQISPVCQNVLVVEKMISEKHTNLKSYNNKIMAFRRYKGKTKLMYFVGDTAREVRDGSLVSITDSGTIVPVDNDSGDHILGVARLNDTVVSDTTVRIPVEVPVETAVEWIIDTDSDAGAADSDVGAYIAVDTAGGASVNAGDSNATRVNMNDSAPPYIFVTGVVSASQIIGVLPKLAWFQTTDTLDTN